MLAWPVVSQGLDAAIAVPDAAALAAMHDLRALGVDAGPCGAASLAGVRLALTGAGADDRRAALGITDRSVIVLVSTDGRTSGAG
jgi:diaminopropionate ammonia-lyase